MAIAIKTKVDAVSIFSATDRAKSRIDNLRKNLEDIDNDPDKDNRLSKSLCKHCFYLHKARLGGAMMTSRACGICDSQETYSSTATDPLCLPCAKENGLCKQCGGDIDLKQRRNKRPFQK